MQFKKYLFLVLSLLSSSSRANNNCYKFYIGGDLGIGQFAINSVHDWNIDSQVLFFEEKDMADWCLANSSPVFLGGGRVGLAYDASECWYLAIEGNIHIANKNMSFFNGFFTRSLGEYDNTVIRFADKTKFIAGVNAHLGFKFCEENVALYVLGGYKYLKRDYFTLISFKSSSEGVDTFNQNFCGNFKNNGWTLGLGTSVNVACNCDFRLEGAYAGFSSKCFKKEFTEGLPDSLQFDKVSISAKSNAKLVYGLASLAYNF